MTEFPVFVQARVVWALILRETQTRFGDTRLGYVWALIEPIAHVAILSGLYKLLQRSAPVGTLETFFITGIMPFFLFNHTASRLSRALSANFMLLRLPPVTALDVMAARAILQGVTWVVVFLILLIGLTLMGKGLWPAHPEVCALAALVTFFLGCGVGMINAVLNGLFKSWDRVYTALTRPLYLLSGIFYVVDYLPEQARRALSWNPLVHAIEWFRTGFFRNFTSLTLDPQYLITWAVGSMFLGLCLERVFRSRIITR
mgnify:CR=1 FL=1